MTLKQSEAQYRSQLIVSNSITYSLHLNLNPASYTGLSEIKFSLVKEHNFDNLFIDCSAKKIIKFVVNGKLKNHWKHSGSHLYFGKGLQAGENHALVEYQTVYDNDERGLMSFVDIDGKQYLYTTLEAYFAHRIFAIFDQPDLKAIMNLSVTCPLQWKSILSNEHPLLNQKFNKEAYLSKSQSWHKQNLSQFIQTQNDRLMAVFPPTKLMPTYLFCVIAGPFQKIELKQLYNGIPMSLYCSSTNLAYVQKMAPFLFETTVECMRFFQQFFGAPYQFSKYDQIFVHQMQSCAMENTGMVTYHDAEYIWYHPVTLQKALDLADTMAHQLAHHWFGNLTTMKWWDDLWLNQSFAEFMGYYVLQCIQKNLKIVKFESSMAQFLNKKSTRGYPDDKSIITHPIRGIVDNTAVAQSIFDGITYAKGAATLKQLLYLMGSQNFSVALKDYFTKFAFKNTTLDDFIQSLEAHFNNEHGVTLKEWKKLWLQNASLNQLEPVWWNPNKFQPNNQPILTIKQRPYTEKYPTLRPHKIKIALFKEDCTFDILQVFIPAQPQTYIPIDPEQSKKYKAVMLNYQDHGFAKVIFDELSQQFFMKNLLKIDDILTRTYIWTNFYHMVEDAVIPSTKYLDLVISNIGQQKSDTILERSYERALLCIRKYTPQPHRKELYCRLFYFTFQLLKRSDPAHINRVVILKYNLCKIGVSDLAIRCLYKWHQGNYPALANFELSNQNRWDIIVNIFAAQAIPLDKKLALLKEMVQRDSSENGKLQKLKCLTIICSNQQWLKHYDSLLDHHNTTSVNTKKYIMEGLTYHKQLMNKCKDRYFKDIEVSSKHLQSEHLRYFIELMQPTDDELEMSIAGYRGIQINEDRLGKAKYRMMKVINELQNRQKAYHRFMLQFQI